MQGEFEEDLMSQTCFKTQLAAIKEISKEKIYSTHNVLQIEAAGFEVLGGLLDKVVPALAKDAAVRTSGESRNCTSGTGTVPPRQKTLYESLLSATDFVSGMTDSYAVTLYRRLRGMELPTS